MIVQLKTTKDKFSKLYLMVWNGSLNLSKQEMNLLSLLIDKYTKLVEEGVPKEYIWSILFSTESRKELQKDMGEISIHYLGNILKMLKDKKVIHEYNSTYMLDSKIIPTKELTFKFDVV